MNNPEKNTAIIKEWRENHLEKSRKNYRRSSSKRLSTFKGKLNSRMSVLIYQAIRKNKAGKHWGDLVEYTLNDLKQHLEKQFKNGMNWEEFMKGNIHIDHKIPKSVFNYTKPEHIDFKKCWSLSNLQPMWAKDNLFKHTKLSKPFQPSLAI